MRTHRFVAATSTFLVAVTFSATTAWGVLAHSGPTPVKAPAPSCQEDQPCWDCHTMGNHICGTDWAVIVPNDDGAGVLSR